ncbi:MAG: PAS domain-containing protein, partial [Oscillospiraceae bacterium]|nr:PAS domain-containing protein [Oscillospiraceae bacterium]
MSETREFIQESVIRDMSEGLLTLGLDGVITSVNPAAERILDRPERELAGKRFAAAFFGQEENDSFNQLVLDAIYNAGSTQNGFVPYNTGKATKQLYVTTSFLHRGTERVGVVAVLSDVSELFELRDAVKAMNRIKALNGQLEMRNKLLNETFGRFLSDEIVRQLLETPDGLALGGKKRRLTILMSDLRGFTALSERMEPQALIHQLNHYLGEMTEIIQANAGTIIEFIGDGILAIFGAPAPSERHEAEAVRAAVEMQRRMAEINRWNAAQGYPTLEMGVGVNTGEVIVGNIGSEKRTKYGVVGSHVNLCGRIESYTVGGEILISPQTREGCGNELEVAEEREVMPKGVREPLILALVGGFGGVSCREAEDAPVPLETPMGVRFQPIHDKHVDEESASGRLTALSLHEALLSTDTPLKRFDNLEMEAGGMDGILCKVIAQRDDGFLIRFTSTPEGFAEWANALP